jgi:uncharacterized membrane protein YebE (DUF533 family)
MSGVWGTVPGQAADSTFLHQPLPPETPSANKAMTPAEFETNIKAMIAAARLDGMTEQEVALLLREAADELLPEPAWSAPAVFLMPPR